MENHQRRRNSLIENITGIEKRKADLIDTYLILGVLLGKTNHKGIY